MCRVLQAFLVAVLSVVTAGCGLKLGRNAEDPETPAPAVEAATDLGAGPFGSAKETPLLAPFAGNWSLDFEKTLTARAADGATPGEIDQMRKLRNVPQLAELGAHLTIENDIALGDPFPFSEYRFFNLHKHGEMVCGKAWHHEDRFDPGDMSKCYVRLTLIDADLKFDVRMLDGLPDSNDPDLLNTPPPEGGSAEGCDADSPPGADWSDWTTHVFTRSQ